MAQVRYESTRPSGGAAGRFVKFAVLGATGLLVNTGVLAALTAGAHLFYLASAFVATEIAIAWNFVLSESWVFASKKARRAGRLASFAILNNIAFALSGPLLWLLVTVFGVHYLVANAASIVALMLVRFAIADRLIWRARKQSSPAPRHVVSRRQWVALVASALRAE